MNCSSLVSGAAVSLASLSAALTMRSISPGSSFLAGNFSQSAVSKLPSGKAVAGLSVLPSFGGSADAGCQPARVRIAMVATLQVRTCIVFSQFDASGAGRSRRLQETNERVEKMLVLLAA